MFVHQAAGSRIAVGGFMHETNTFQAARTTLEAFVSPGDRPPLTRGEPLLTRFRGTNNSIAGAIDALSESGATLLPLLWCAATPSGPVTREAYETICGMLIEDLRRALPLDGVSLALHGAMVAEHVEDGDGELVRRVREAVGPGIFISVSLDMHANISPQLFANADALAVYQTYPHVDMAETGAKSAALLTRMIASGKALKKAFRQLPFLIPLPWQCTLIEPARSIVEGAKAVGAANDASVYFSSGFPAADVFHCGPSIVGYGDDQDRVDAAVEEIFRRACAAESRFAGKLWTPEAAIAEAMRLTKSDPTPVILADAQDNPGAGGSGDATGILDALLQASPPRAALGILRDGGAATAAHAAGRGATIVRSLGAGGRSVPWAVEALGDGNMRCTGPMLGGTTIALGPMALLRHEGILVIVASKAVQALDAAPFAHLGIDLATFPVVVLKSAVHFRAQFEPMSQATLCVVSPGAFIVDTSKIPFARLRPEIRRVPLLPS